jgi:hypothetical protein
LASLGHPAHKAARSSRRRHRIESLKTDSVWLPNLRLETCRTPRQRLRRDLAD